MIVCTYCIAVNAPTLELWNVKIFVIYYCGSLNVTKMREKDKKKESAALEKIKKAVPTINLDWTINIIWKILVI